IIVCSFGVRIQHITVEGLFSVDLGIYSWPLTILWLVGVTNAVNLIDGLDGLAAGISAIVCGFLAILAVHLNNPIMAILMLAMVGSLVGFLFFNFNPAKIFMGDCGSLFIGFMIAASSVLTSTKSHALVGVALPVLALGIPIFDTFFAMLRRFIQRRSMFAPDKSHFHHRLLDHGFGHAHVAVIAYAVTIIIAGMGLFLLVTRSFASIIVFASSLLLLVLMFRIVGSVRLRETMAGLRTKRAISGRARQEIKNFEEAQLHFRNAKNFDDWWASVCLAAEKLDFTSVTLPITNRDGTYRFLQWEAPAVSSNNLTLNHLTLNTEIKIDSLIHLVVPVKDRRGQTPLRLQIETCSFQSVEAAGRRVALFSRLLEEHALMTLDPEDKDA
ncbi:MAG: undecaprenyl/decaprenyl-phosphate alpha-N-acetylglucosaminyl 1-phosphate transferase, partial [Desulfobacterales bacterium]|nr:undecaprenyl/decaprenyl-phosphate alpha-N-acetylglucosaminyl 1-phosphate transferase [Desulfobacterales bacterium]